MLLIKFFFKQIAKFIIITSSNKNIKKPPVTTQILKTRDRDYITSRPRLRLPAKDRDRYKTETTKKS